jgi:hypothetical protein
MVGVLKPFQQNAAHLFTGLPFFALLKTSSYNGGRTQTLSTLFRIAGFISLRRLPRLLRGAYSNPFNKMLRILLGFLLLICLQKRAFDTASKQKTLSLS